MEPLSIDHNLYLDYRDSQSIKFFNKGRERLTGEPFSGKNIFSRLKRILRSRQVSSIGSQH
jgi:hypothetical protein